MAGPARRAGGAASGAASGFLQAGPAGWQLVALFSVSLAKGCVQLRVLQRPLQSAAPAQTYSWP